MSQKLPPVPPENRSPKGPGEPARHPDSGQATKAGRAGNPDKTGQSANTKVNTTNQGLQQDR